jgi:hypothetical protein
MFLNFQIIMPQPAPDHGNHPPGAGRSLDTLLARVETLCANSERQFREMRRVVGASQRTTQNCLEVLAR